MEFRCAALRGPRRGPTTLGWPESRAAPGAFERRASDLFFSLRFLFIVLKKPTRAELSDAPLRMAHARRGMLLALALAASAAAHTPPRRAVLRGAAAVAAGCLLPRGGPAIADRGKDLYSTDKVSGGVGTRVQDAALPQFDASGALVDGTEIYEEVAYRTVRSGDAASCRILKSWVDTDGGGLRDPVTGTTATLLSMSATPTSLAAIADLGRPEQLAVVQDLRLEQRLVAADLVRRLR